MTVPGDEKLNILFYNFLLKVNVEALGKFSKVLKHLKVKDFQVFEFALFCACFLMILMSWMGS